MKFFGYLFCFVFAFSIVSAGTMICIDLDDPSAPFSLNVSGNSDSRVLNWDSSIDTPNCSGIDKYIISRRGVEISRVEGSVLTFIDNNRLSSGSYIYSVYAIDLIGRNGGIAIANNFTIESYSGSSSGGSSITSYICTENWECGEWTECVGNEMRRLCDDLNECGTEKDKPVTYQECGLMSQNDEILLSNEEEDEDSKNFFSTITGNVIGGMGNGSLILVVVVILLLLSALGVVVYKKRH